MKKIRKGVYEYKGYRVTNCGYYPPDQCIWWEAVNLENGCADFHATTKKEIQKLIDEYDGIPYPKWGDKKYVMNNDFVVTISVSDKDI